MISVGASSTDNCSAIAVAIFEWWRAKSQFEVGCEVHFSQTENEWISSNSDASVGLAVLRIHDYFEDFKAAVELDPAAKFVMDTYVFNVASGNTFWRDQMIGSIRKWIAECVGKKVRETPEWQERLKQIKASQRKLKTVKKVLEA